MAGHTRAARRRLTMGGAIRFLYRLLGLFWQAKAITRGPGEWAKQRARSYAHRQLARGLRHTFLRPKRR